jgi:excisionase family DNA binding protein
MSLAVAIQPIVSDVKQTAQALQIHPNTVRNLIRRGELPASRVGDRVMVRRDALQEFLQETQM